MILKFRITKKPPPPTGGPGRRPSPHWSAVRGLTRGQSLVMDAPPEKLTNLQMSLSSIIKRAGFSRGTFQSYRSNGSLVITQIK